MRTPNGRHASCDAARCGFAGARVAGASLLLAGLATLWPSQASAQAQWRQPWQVKQCSGSGTRQYASQLMNIPKGQEWLTFCRSMPADINGQHFDHPTRCIENAGVWGEFDGVRDDACSPLRFDGNVTFDDDTATTRAFTSGTVEIWACASNVGGACSWSKIASTMTDAHGRYSISVPGPREVSDQYVARVVGENPSAYIFAQDTLNVFFADLGSPRLVPSGQRTLTFDKHFLSTGGDRFVSMHLNGVQKLLHALPFVNQFRDPREGDTMGKVAVSPAIVNPLVPPIVYMNLGIIHMHPEFLFTRDPDRRLLHEYGHYVQERIGAYALDPRQHTGCEVSDPEYAWFEGFPTFFWRAVRLLNAADYRAANASEVPRSNLDGPVSCGGPLAPADSVELFVSDILFLLMNDATNTCSGEPACLRALWQQRLTLIMGIVDKEFDHDAPGAKNLDRFRAAWIARGASRSYIDAVYAKFGIPPAPPPVDQTQACLASCNNASRACLADAQSRPERLACYREANECKTACRR